MENKEYYIKLIESRVWGYNEYWDEAPTNSMLRTETEEAVEQLISYATILKNAKKE